MDSCVRNVRISDKKAKKQADEVIDRVGDPVSARTTLTETITEERTPIPNRRNSGSGIEGAIGIGEAVGEYPRHSLESTRDTL